MRNDLDIRKDNCYKGNVPYQIMKNLLALLLVIGIATASINIFSPKNGSVYYIGDSAQIIGNIESDRDCSGPASIIFDGKILEQVDSAFNKGSAYTFDSIFNTRSIKAEKRNHELKISTQCFGDTSSKFFVTDVLEINYEINRNQLLLGEPLIITAYAVKKDRVNNITKITIEGNDFIDSANYKFSVPGNYTVVINAQDQFGNKGSLNLSVEVSNLLIVTAKADKNLYNPSDKVWLELTVTDGFGRERSATVKISEINRFYQINGHGSISFDLAANIKPGPTPISVIASVNSNRGEKDLDINIAKVPTYFNLSSKDSYLKGETALLTLDVKDQVNESVANLVVPLIISDANGAIVVNAQISGGGSYPLNTANLNSGAYTAKVFYNSKEYAKQFTISPASISQTPTGITGLVTGDTGTWSLAIGALALIIGVIRYLQGKRIEAKL